MWCLFMRGDILTTKWFHELWKSVVYGKLAMENLHPNPNFKRIVSFRS